MMDIFNLKSLCQCAIFLYHISRRCVGFLFSFHCTVVVCMKQLRPFQWNRQVIFTKYEKTASFGQFCLGLSKALFNPGIVRFAIK